ncbi:MAG: hypothetical protein RL653_3909, partial [Pseudomonadota bacterium]
MAPPPRTPGRALVIAFTAASALALLGSVLSYQADVAQVRSALRDRVLQLAQVYAEALAQHLQVMESGVARAADGADLSLGPVGLFNAGMARVDANGNLVEGTLPLELRGELQAWSIQLPPVNRAQFRVLGGGRLAVAYPRVREGRSTGSVVAVTDTVASPLPGGRAVGDFTALVILDRAGKTLVPTLLPDWARGPAFHERV